MRMIYINASDVAAAVGLNRFKSPSDIISAYTKRNAVPKLIIDAEEYMISTDDTVSVISKLGNEIQKEEVRTIVSELLQKETDIQAKVTEPEEVAKLNQQLAEKKVELATLNKQVVEQALNSAVVAPDAQESKEKQQKVMEVLPSVLENRVNTFVNTERGKQGEDKILNRYEMENNTVVTERNSRMYYLHVGEFNIGGRIDGFDKMNRRLVEVKKRRNKFLGMPKYEKVQCEIYMRMLGLSECVHVEEYNDSQKETAYCRNEKLWREIEDGLEHFYALYEDDLNQL